MPHYYFDLQSEPDLRGMSLPDAAAARRMAMRYAGDLIREIDAPPMGKCYWRMDVREDTGPVLFSLVFDLMPVAAKGSQPEPAARPKRVANGGPDWQLV